MASLPNPRTQPTLTIPEAGELFGLGRDSAYRAVKNGTIPSIQLSPRRVVCPTAAVLRLLDINPAVVFAEDQQVSA